MTKVERIEQEVLSLSSEELADFRKWFAAYDFSLWDQQWEQDAKAGKLDRFRDEALAEYKSRETKEL